MTSHPRCLSCPPARVLRVFEKVWMCLGDSVRRIKRDEDTGRYGAGNKQKRQESEL